MHVFAFMTIGLFWTNQHIALVGHTFPNTKNTKHTLSLYSVQLRILIHSNHNAIKYSNSYQQYNGNKVVLFIAKGFNNDSTQLS